MLVPAGFCRLREAGGFAVVAAALRGVPLASWWEAGQPLAAAAGRGGVRVLDIDIAAGGRAVARDYRRGGALRALLRDRYLTPARAFRELAVLAELRARAVAVVEPLAALARRSGPAWRLRLVTRLVERALPLPAFLAARPAQRAAALRAAGATVARAFAAGLRHPDLHPDNLLVREAAGGPQALLLDLDRARLGAPLTARERDGMLLRMARYLERHAARLAIARGDRARFLQGMGLSRSERRAELRRLAPAYERAAVRHRWAWRLGARR